MEEQDELEYLSSLKKRVEEAKSSNNKKKTYDGAGKNVIPAKEQSTMSWLADWGDDLGPVLFLLGAGMSMTGVGAPIGGGLMFAGSAMGVASNAYQAGEQLISGNPGGAAIEAGEGLLDYFGMGSLLKGSKILKKLSNMTPKEKEGVKKFVKAVAENNVGLGVGRTVAGSLPFAYKGVSGDPSSRFRMPSGYAFEKSDATSVNFSNPAINQFLNK